VGVSANVLSRILSLSDQGMLPPGASVIELGTQQLHCKGSEKFLREFIDRISAKNPTGSAAPGISHGELVAISQGGFLSKVLKACGFQYAALDIFDAEDTVLFDLNRQEPTPEMRDSYDLVTNFGTTEHIVNQYLAFKTMHEITKPGGVMFHELPLSGFHTHGYFSYNPLFFKELAEANQYEVVMQAYSKNHIDFVTAPDFMRSNGYPDPGYYDYGIQFIFRKTASAPFRIPLEVSTSLDVSPKFLTGLVADGAIGDLAVSYGSTGGGRMDLSRFTGVEIQRELLRRYMRRAIRMLKGG
jgi:Methyltransferase domain